MILGNQIEWALHCLTVMAGLPEGARVSTKQLAEFHGVPKEYLSKCLQAVSQAGLVETQLGPRGGYRLARPAQEITFLQIVEAVEGTDRTFRCREIRGNNPCLKKSERKFASVCQIAAVMYEADRAWRDVLRRKNLAEVVRELAGKLSAERRNRTAEWFARGAGEA